MSRSPVPGKTAEYILRLPCSEARHMGQVRAPGDPVDPEAPGGDADAAFLFALRIRNVQRLVRVPIKTATTTRPSNPANHIIL